MDPQTVTAPDAAGKPQTTVVRDAWDRAQNLTVHGWVYSLENGLVKDLGMELTGDMNVTECYARALHNLEHPDAA